MSNSWFQFKKFIIRQDKTAMKVGTDGVLLGAWANVSECRNILDIGTGTGLIALMLAQHSKAMIDAIEIDPAAAEQAFANVAESPWADRINVKCTSFQEFCNKTPGKYDLIICNPPFFRNSLKAINQSRSLARHSDTLELRDLLAGAKNLLKTDGHLNVIFPFEKESEITILAKEYDLFPANIVRIRPDLMKNYRRVLMDFSFSDGKLTESEMNIETGARHQYSQEYLALTRDYYNKI